MSRSAERPELSGRDRRIAGPTISAPTLAAGTDTATFFNRQILRHGR
jgi:hypothetical protein